MIDRDHKLPLARQAKAVGISRGSIYYRPRPVGEAGLGLMRRIDELHLEYPFAGSRMMRGLLRQEGLPSGRRHIATLMRRMGIDALYRKPNTSRRRPGHTVYPYLLRGLEVSRPNQVWAMDITYIPMARGFVYLAAVMDWHSRKVLAWRVSVTIDTGFCVEALEESLGRHGAPEIFNTDQGQIYGAEVDPQFRGQPPAFLGDIARELVGAVFQERIVCRPPVDLAGFAFRSWDRISAANTFRPTTVTLMSDFFGTNSWNVAGARASPSRSARSSSDS